MTGDGPLVGVRVVEVGQLVAGPYAAGVLADLGAEVIKVEPPTGGDAVRGIATAGHPWFWQVEGRNKRCVTLDLASGEGQELLLRLVAWADVLIENLKPGRLDGWNLGDDRLREANPGLVVAHISGYGHDGPYRDRPSTDRQALAFSGIAALTGYPDAAPVKVGAAISDFVAGLHAAVGVLAALHRRDHVGEPGQSVDVALYDGMFRMTVDMVQEHLATGAVRQRTGNRNPSVPGGIFRSSDGRWLMIAASTDRLWRNLVTAIDRPDLGADERLATNAGRQQHADALEAELAAWVGSRDATTVERVLGDHGVPAGRLYDARDIVADEHFLARESLVRVAPPGVPDAPITMPGVVPRLSGTPGRIRHAGAELGADNDAVYRDVVGLAPGEIDGLRRRGVI